MKAWAAIIYGRTYNMDFRFIALPDDFSSAERDWAEAHILTALRSPEHLSDKPRWVLIKSASHCVFGSACTAADLVGDIATGDTELLRDSVGRPLYLFLGYATRSASPAFPRFWDRGLAPLRPLLDIVRAHWRDESFNYKTYPANPYEFAVNVDAPAPADQKQHAPPLNTNHHFIAFWPESDERYLWDDAASCQPPMSLCLGLANKRDCIHGPFLNVTFEGSMERNSVMREPSAKSDKPKTAGREHILPLSEDRPSPEPPHSAILLDLLCAGIGGAVGVWAGGGLKRLGLIFGIFGFGLGWAIGSYMSSQLSAPDGSSDNTRPQGLRRSNRDQHPGDPEDNRFALSAKRRRVDDESPSDWF
jgi:hypothetical protein